MGDAPKWLARWKEDRPAVDDHGPPILVYFGGKDPAVKPGLAKCAIDKLNTDIAAAGATTKITVCLDPTASHRDIVRTADSDAINVWIAARAGIGSDPDPSTCPAFPSTETCTVPPNDW